MESNSNQAMLQKIYEARFACVELQLYLDTHPDDEVAKADYLSYADKLNQLIARYEQVNGPLMNFGQSPTAAGSWVFGQWPWD